MSTIFATPANIATLRQIIETSRARSAWSRGVNAYALDLLDNAEYIANYNFETWGEYPALTEELLLNGASNWGHYSAGGRGLIYTRSILSRLCTPSEFKKWESGKLAIDPIECETRALYQAFRVIVVACSNLA